LEPGSWDLLFPGFRLGYFVYSQEGGRKVLTAPRLKVSIPGLRTRKLGLLLIPGLSWIKLGLCPGLIGNLNHSGRPGHFQKQKPNFSGGIPAGFPGEFFPRKFPEPNPGFFPGKKAPGVPPGSKGGFRAPRVFRGGGGPGAGALGGGNPRKNSNREILGKC